MKPSYVWTFSEEYTTKSIPIVKHCVCGYKRKKQKSDLGELCSKNTLLTKLKKQILDNFLTHFMTKRLKYNNLWVCKAFVAKSFSKEFIY